MRDGRAMEKLADTIWVRQYKVLGSLEVPERLKDKALEDWNKHQGLYLFEAENHLRRSGAFTVH